MITSLNSYRNEIGAAAGAFQIAGVGAVILIGYVAHPNRREVAGLCNLYRMEDRD